MNALKINWPVARTMISDSAVETRSQIENRPAITARPSHNAASAHTLVMLILAVLPLGSLHQESTKNRLAAGHDTHSPPPFSREGAITAGGVFGGPHPPRAPTNHPAIYS